MVYQRPRRAGVNWIPNVRLPFNDFDVHESLPLPLPMNVCRIFGRSFFSVVFTLGLVLFLTRTDVMLCFMDAGSHA